MSPRSLALALALALLPLARQSELVSRYDALALQGDLRGARSLFESAPEDQARELRERFTARFVERTETFPSAGDELVDALLAEYRRYWADSLLHGRGEDRGLADLSKGLGAVLEARELDPGGDVLETLEAELARRGVHGIYGVTPPLYDLLLWRGEARSEYSVELTDAQQPVTVVFLSDFVSRGWSHFATFGRSSTGGWATREALFCLRESYDLDSESFLVSYLRHEGRHFADYEKYPALESADLEYRAKLTELAFARETALALLCDFTVNAAPGSPAPHPRANHAVVANLSRAAFDAGDPVSPERWSTIDPDELREAARWLLEEHDRELEALGARTTRGVLAE
jgi:hypothetical protein